jgi:hypothetical protein
MVEVYTLRRASTMRSTKALKQIVLVLSLMFYILCCLAHYFDPSTVRDYALLLTACHHKLVHNISLQRILLDLYLHHVVLYLSLLPA